jgi:hypothetical protein
MSQNLESPSGILSWRTIGTGAILGSVLLWISFRHLYCFYTFQFPAASVITFIVGVLSGILGNVLKSLQAKLLRTLTYILMWLLVTLAVMMIVIPFFTQLNKNFCVPDLPILINMIEQEGKAVIAKDMSTIRSIYDPSAVIARADTSEFWQAYNYYSLKFAREDHCTVSHSDYLVQDFSTDQVRLTTSSRGTYGEEGQGCTKAYANPPGSDEWTFQKISGEWKIVYFEFNKEK